MASAPTGDASIRMSDSHYNIANIFLEPRQFAQAEQHYKQAPEIRPN